MRIRVWNAYASNNSGSYTIVGVLPSAEIAARTAEELRTVIDAHTEWHATWDFDEASLEASPLAQFCREHALSWRSGQGGSDDWPEHHADNRPSVVIVGARLIVHHPYTVGLPATFGELLYKRGGRVEHEERHAHHPMVVTATFWWGWTGEARAKEALELPKLIAALTDPSGPLAEPNHDDWPAAWQTSGGGFGDAPFTVAVVFDDLVAGIAALRTVGAAHGAEIHLRLAEPQGKGDPLAFLRPSVPAVARFDVQLIETGGDPRQLVEALVEATGRPEYHVQRLVEQPTPTTIVRGRLEASAREVARAIESAGAQVELVRSDG